VPPGIESESAAHAAVTAVEPRRAPVAEVALVGLLVALYAVVLVRTAWVSDDAYLTLRTVDNLVAGYGPRWNVDERVQVYTHPLWMLLITAFYAFTKEAFYTVALLSIAVSIAAVLVLTRLGPPRAAAVGVAILVLSKAFVDYSTSGLENPLAHVLLAAFSLQLAAARRLDGRRLFALAATAGLATLNRMDHGVLLAPALAWALFRHRRPRGLLLVAAGFAPFIAWELFSILYYGVPYPNTALAKLHTGVGAGEMASQGLRYLENSLREDPLTLTAIAAALVAVALRRRPHELALGLGILAYLDYVVRIGGDFMSGRFLTAPLCVAVALLVGGGLPGGRRAAALGLAAALALGLLARPIPTLASGRDYGLRRTKLIDRWGVADERRFYFSTLGMWNQLPDARRPAAAPTRRGRALRRTAAPLAVEGAVGVLGYAAGPTVHVVDYHALGDPLLARLPMASSDPRYTAFLRMLTHSTPVRTWRIGHFIRNVPRGYLTTLLTGESRFEDPGIRAFWKHLAAVTRGPLLDGERLREVVRLNLGEYQAMLPTARPAPESPERAELWALRPDHPESWYQHGLVMASEGQTETAFNDMMRVLQLDPAHAEALAVAAQTAVRLGRYQEGMELAERALRVEPDYAQPWMTIARAQRMQRRPLEAVASYEHALKVDPVDAAQIMDSIGEALVQAGQGEAALGWLERARALDGEDAEVRCNMGGALLLLGRVGEARARFLESLALDPDSDDAALGLADSWLRSNDPSRAREALVRFAAAHPDRGAIHERLARLLDEAGQRAAADTEWRAAARLGLDTARKVLAERHLTP
jgi:arabinofuranosyltransferase